MEQLQSRAAQILLQTFNYKHAGLGKQGGAAAGGLGSARPLRGGGMGGSRTGLIRSASCPQESEATPAFSLIKNIFKTRTEHPQREPKHRERLSPEATPQTPLLIGEKIHAYSPAKGDKVRLGFGFSQAI